MAEAKYPCSICEASFCNPRDLGTHILTSHCEDKSQEVVEARLDPRESIVMDVDPLDRDVIKQEQPEDMLPRQPNLEEQKQKFLAYRRDGDPVNSMRYVCLVCSKVFMSRYNIRMHLNTHTTGRSVHKCPYCSRFFANRHSCESHVASSHQYSDLGQARQVGQVYTENAEDDEIEEDSDSVFGPQIVSVKTLSTPFNNNGQDNHGFGNYVDDDEKYEDDLEEIQIEPDIIDNMMMEQDQQQQQQQKGHHNLPPVQPTQKQHHINIPTIPMPPMKRKLPVLTVKPPEQLLQKEPPQQTQAVIYTCSFCNVRFSQQILLVTHLNQHVNFAGSQPTPEDLHKGFMTVNVPVNSGQGPCGNRVKFMCLSCGKMFGREQQVKIHLNVHYGDNIYNCRFCEKVFANFNAFEEHVKTHSEEYRFNCKSCNVAFMNRNVMISHQKTCRTTNNTTTSSTTEEETTSVPEKKFKVVLSSDEIKDLIRAKDEEIQRQEAAAAMTDPCKDSKRRIIPTFKAHFASPTHTSSSTTSEETVIKPVVRKRAPIFPFDPEDHYVPDNNSNNIMDKAEIHPPPTTVERKQGYCLRPFRNTGQQRYICTVCGKHYTTMYNMRQHRNIHTGAGLHTCRYCGRDFTHKHVWETHERIHTGERPFKCPTCPKDFADRSNYNSHRKLCAMSKRK